MISNIETWFFKPLLFELLIKSIISSNEASKHALVFPKLSNAPPLIKDSTHFLFTASPLILSAKSPKSLNSPFLFLSSVIKSTAAIPTFFILPNPKRIAFPSTVNFVSDLFISGCKISMFNLLHSLIYIGTLSKFPKNEFSIAAINSAG